jgi:hypothetical protein
MAEVIRVASSVAGLMTLADVVVRRGYKFINDVREAGETARKIVGSTTFLVYSTASAIMLSDLRKKILVISLDSDTLYRVLLSDADKTSGSFR